MYTFEDIIGNENIIKSMQSAILNQKVSHAYIIEGLKGMGKRLLANAFAKTLECESGSATPCGECVSCRTFDSGNHTDVIYVRPAKTKALGVDDIREQINKAIEVKPYHYPYKIFIVENAGDMSVAAQNALLKTLEEPPPYGVFLLLTSNINSFLPTILSRCIAFKIKPAEFYKVKSYLLERLDISEESSHFCAVYAQGVIGRAREIAENEGFMAMRMKIIDMIHNIEEKDLIDIFNLEKEFEGMKENIQEVLDIIYMWYRDIAVFQETQNEAMLLQKDIKDKIADEARRSDAKAVYDKLESVWQTKLRLKQNANFQLAIEVMLLNLRQFLAA